MGLKGIKKAGVAACLIGLLAIGGICNSQLVFAHTIHQQSDVKKFIKSVKEDKSHKVEGIKKLVINSLISSNIVIQPTDKEDFSFELSGTITSNHDFEVPTINISEIDDSININIQSSSEFFRKHSSDVCFTVFVPKEYKQDLFISNSFGNINLNELALENITINSGAGIVDIKSTIFTQGNFYTTFGDLNIIDSEGKVSAVTSSGNISMSFNELKDVTAASTFGCINLTTQKDVAYNYTLSTVFGSIKTIFDTEETIGVTKKLSGCSVNEDTSINIQLNTNSGNINLLSK